MMFWSAALPFAASAWARANSNRIFPSMTVSGDGSRCAKAMAFASALRAIRLVTLLELSLIVVWISMSANRAIHVINYQWSSAYYAFTRFLKFSA